MTSEKSRSASTPRVETSDRGLLTPDAGPDPARADYTSADTADKNDALHENQNVDAPDLDPTIADEQNKLADRQITIANISAG